MMTDEAVEPHIVEGILSSASEGAYLVQLEMDEPALDIVASIDQFLYAWGGGVHDLPPDYEEEALPYSLGALWGEQLVRELDWEWRDILNDDPRGFQGVGVVSPDRALCIYPFHYIMACMAQPDADCTILLAYNMLVAGNTGDQPPGGYLNVMMSVRRIVPRGPYRPS